MTLIISIFVIVTAYLLFKFIKSKHDKRNKCEYRRLEYDDLAKLGFIKVSRQCIIDVGTFDDIFEKSDDKYLYEVGIKMQDLSSPYSEFIISECVLKMTDVNDRRSIWTPIRLISDNFNRDFYLVRNAMINYLDKTRNIT